MKKFIKKSEQSKIIRSVYSVIKKDNLDQFKNLLEQNSWLLNFKNNKREGLLFYAFACNSEKIINYILEQKPELIIEKNILNLNIIHELVLKNKNVDFFLEKMKFLDEKTRRQIFLNKDPQGNNLILLAAKVGNVGILNKIVNNCEFFEELKKYTNSYGQNIAHFLSTNKLIDFSDIQFKIEGNLLNQIDNINGLSPLMLSAYHQNINNFSYFFEINPAEQTSLLDNSLLHFAAHNKDHLVADYLIGKNLFTNKKNKFNQTPLQISLLKGLHNVADIIFKPAKKYELTSEEIILSPKISLTNPVLFNKIIFNKNNVVLNDEEKNKFIENLFLYSNEKTIKNIFEHNRYKDWFKCIDFNNLFFKTIMGKKEMALKTDFLLKDKQILSEQEAILTCKSLEKIPASQIIFLFNNSTLLDKISKEHKVLFIALALSKGLNPSIIKENEINENEEVQKYLKSALKGNKIQTSTKHITNIESWLNIFKDKKVVLKHYGNIIAKHIHPFHYLDNSFKFLGKENKKELVYYTITSLFKKDIEISNESLAIISKHPNLLSSVYAGIIKYGKIPCNKDLLNLLEKSNHNFLSADDLIFFLNKSSKKSEEAINLVNKTINLFNFKNIDIKNFCHALEKHKDHTLVLDKIITKLPEEEKRKFVFEYLNSYVNYGFKTNDNLLIDLVVAYCDNSTISSIFKNSILQDNHQNIIFLEKLIKKNKINIDFNLFLQDLFNNENYSSCLKLISCTKDKLNFSKLELSNINWEKIDIEICSFSHDDQLFKFILENSNRISEKQVNQIINSLINTINKDISIITIDKVLSSLENNIHKIEEYSLIKISEYMLKKYFIDNPANKIMTEENFNHYFSLLSHNKNGLFLKNIQQNENFSLIDKDIRTTIDREVLNEELSTKKVVKNKTMKI